MKKVTIFAVGFGMIAATTAQFLTESRAQSLAETTEQAHEACTKSKVGQKACFDHHEIECSCSSPPLEVCAWGRTGNSC